MILRLRPEQDGAGATASRPTANGMWDEFAQTQSASHHFAGYVTQPAHAGLAGDIARNLHQEVFGELPVDVVDCIALHDLGWAQDDLLALERSARSGPEAFLAVPAQRGVEAWRRSVRAAEERSPLSRILTGRHFCLLAPRDGDPAHEQFIAEEHRNLERLEGACGYPKRELDRFTAAFGFCDLLSLYLCSGRLAEVRIPLAHPADPASKNAPHVVVSTAQAGVLVEDGVVVPGSRVSVPWWARSSSGCLSSERAEWNFI